MRVLGRKLYALKGVIVGGIFLVIIGLFIWKIGIPAYGFAKANSLGATSLYNVFFAKTVPVNETDNRTNVLFLGIGGVNHEGADLTDTMLLYSFNQQTRKSYVLAIPRDLWSETLRDKVNSAYHYGEEKKPGGGMLLAKATVEEVTGIPIHYAYLIDFAGFEAIIDVLGGVDVTVDRSFDDNKYPIAGKENDMCEADPEFACRYESLHFDAGLQHMDGKTALKFARSRNAEGDEGSDFARSKRQEKVLEAVKNKLLDRKTYTSFAFVNNLAEQFKSSTKTDANLGTSMYIGRLFLQLKDRKTISIEDKLTNPPAWQYDGKWVLAPIEDWVTLKDFIAKSLAE